VENGERGVGKRNESLKLTFFPHFPLPIPHSRAI
jgi:hypothetical protein